MIETIPGENMQGGIFDESGEGELSNFNKEEIEEMRGPATSVGVLKLSPAWILEVKENSVTSVRKILKLLTRITKSNALS